MGQFRKEVFEAIAKAATIKPDPNAPQASKPPGSELTYGQIACLDRLKDHIMKVIARRAANYLTQAPGDKVASVSFTIHFQDVNFHDPRKNAGAAAMVSIPNTVEPSILDMGDEDIAASLGAIQETEAWPCM